MAKRCYGCMQLKSSSPICEHCGYDENLTNDPHQLPAGTILGRKYQIGRVLGQGGFGITYVGWDYSLDTPVAIKEYYPKSLVTRDCGSSLSVVCISEKAELPFQTNLERFVREAKIQARLSEIPGVVQIQGMFQENNTVYIVMEYAQGIDLKQYLQLLKRNLTPEETLAIIRPVSYTLEQIHKAGMVHLDISPDNIMICKDGRVKLLDFGAACAVEGANHRKAHADSMQAILKHGFAPLEQYNRNGRIDTWTDVYGLCAVIYYCLTGTVPNDAMDRYMDRDNVDWDLISGLTPVQLAVLKRGLEVVAENRLATVGELRQGLYEQVLPESVKNPAPPAGNSTPAEPDKTGEQIAVEPDEGNRRRKKKTAFRIGAAICAAVVVAGFLVKHWFFQEPEKELQAEPTEAWTETAVAPTEPQMILTEPTETVPTEPVVEEPQWMKNVLMRDATFEVDSSRFWQEEYTKFEYEIYDFFSARPVFNMGIPRSKVTDVFFLDSVATAPESAYDVSAGQDGSVLAWTEKNRKGAFNLYIAGEGGVNGAEACRVLFYGYKMLETVHFNNSFFTDSTEDMSRMFAYCKKLKTVDLESLNTGAAVDMSSMFLNCEELKTLDITGFDTSSVRNMSSMFSGCRKLKTLDLSGFDTSNVEYMSGTFAYMDSMTSIDVSNFDTSRVVDMSGLFRGFGHSEFTSLDLSGFDTSNVKYMDGMFAGCSWLTSLDLSNFDTSRVTDMSSMFSYCRRLTSLDLSSFDTSNVTDMSSMFEMCSLLPVLEISHFDTAKVISMSSMFYKCGYLKKLDVTQLDVTNVKSTSNMFFGCDKLPLEYKKIGGKHVWS